MHAFKTLEMINSDTNSDNIELTVGRVTSGITTISPASSLPNAPLKTVYDFYRQPSIAPTAPSTTSNRSSSYASISSVTSCDEHTELLQARERKIHRFKRWGKGMVSRVKNIMARPPAHPCSLLLQLHALVESMNVPSVYNGEFTHWSILLKLTDHLTHNFPFTDTQLWCVQRTTKQLDELVFGQLMGQTFFEENILDMDETVSRVICLTQKYKSYFCANYDLTRDHEREQEFRRFRQYEQHV